MELLKSCKQYNDINLDNLEFINFINNKISELNLTNARRLRRFIVNLIFEKTGSKRKTISYSYYESLGWKDRFEIFKHNYKFKSFEDFLINNIHSKINIKNKKYVEDKLKLILNLEDSFDINTIKLLFKFKHPSIFNTNHWCELGYSKKESSNIVKEIQIKNNNKRLSKYTKEELAEQSVWSKKYWEKKNNVEGYKKYNRMCKEHYDSVEEYNEMIKKHSKTISENFKRGVYDNFLKPNSISNKEIEFFEFLKTFINVKHKQFIINCRSKQGGSLYFIDGYLKIDDKIILIEFDGLYWHDKEYDNNKDSLILETRDDILGIIRISDKFFKKHKYRLKKEIENGIKEIKDKKSKKIRIY